MQVDFNHKYAGRTLIYDANIVKKIESDDEKITNLIKSRLPIDSTDIIMKKKIPNLKLLFQKKYFF